jgi:phage recombination protein Bet
MNTELQTTKQDLPETELMEVLRNSLYPGAPDNSIKLVLGYCKAAGLDPMIKPVHIVPMWNASAKTMKDVIMPGIGLYRTQASRSGQLAGISEPEFGPEVTETLSGITVTYPKWCKITVKRRMIDGSIAEFPAVELWKENYAVKGGQEKSIAPNTMWQKRPFAQLNKCTESQALRKAFPEFGSQQTADEMEGKAYNEKEINPLPKDIQIREEAPSIDAVLDAIEEMDSKEAQNQCKALITVLTLETDRKIAINAYKRKVDQLKQAANDKVVPEVDQSTNEIVEE